MPPSVPAVQLMTRQFEILTMVSEELNDILPAGNSFE